MHRFTNSEILNLIIDIGNNSTKLYLFGGNEIVLHGRKGDDYIDTICEWVETYDVEKMIISTVVNIADKERERIESLKCKVIWFDSNTKVPLQIAYKTPETLGSDRLAAAVGAHSEANGHNILVIDAGSAITIDFVDSEGVYRGGNISPGIKMRLLALNKFTNKLPYIEKEGDIPEYGYDTETAIRSGVINGICNEIEGYIRYFSNNYGNLLVFLTGGDEKTLKNRIKSSIFADKFLVAKGLNRILINYDTE